MESNSLSSLSCNIEIHFQVLYVVVDNSNSLCTASIVMVNLHLHIFKIYYTNIMYLIVFKFELLFLISIKFNCKILISNTNNKFNFCVLYIYDYRYCIFLKNCISM